MSLHILPPNVSNLIAAGEVVQRPASVVKELVENSVDAGAQNVTVIIEDAGRTLIQVIDDGCGMTPDEAKLSFARHATSKVSAAEDLEAIITYGFRGEALASIAAVAEVIMKSRRKDADTGSETLFSDSSFVSQTEVSTPVGTNISVRNIFYNTPARRKFLKSDAAEFRQILSEFLRVALVRPDVAFKLVSGGKTVYDLRKAVNLKKRITDVEGASSRKMVDVTAQTSLSDIAGFIGDPKDARKGGGNQFFFVNGRFFRSAYLHKAVMKAYEKLIPEGYVPSYFLYLDTDPRNVDINIHPAKTEVKFENEPAVFEIVNAAVREALGRNTFVPSIDFDMEGVPDIPPAVTGQRVHPPKIDYDPLFNPFHLSEPSGPRKPSESVPFDEEPDSLAGAFLAEGPSVPAGAESGEVFTSAATGGESVLTVQGRFVVTTVKSGLLVINVARAKERIFYERFLKSLDNATQVSQGTLFPVVLDLSPSDCSLLAEHAGVVSSLGFDIRPFGEGTVVVSGVPDGLPSDKEAVKGLVADLTALLADPQPMELKRAEIRQKAAASISRSAALTGQGRISEEEARALVEALFSCAEPDMTADGRKCMSIITVDEILKKM